MPKGKSQSTFYDERAFHNTEKLMQIMKYLLYLDSEKQIFFLTVHIYTLKSFSKNYRTAGL